MKKEKIFWMLCNIIMFVVASAMSGGMAMAVTLGENGSDIDPNDGTPLENATPDAEGLGVDEQSSGTTGSAAQQLEFIDNDVNDYVSKHYAYEFPLQTDIMRAAQQIKVTTPEPKAWEIGEANLDCETNDDLENQDYDESVELPVAKNDAKIFKEGATILVEGVDGYDETGTEDGTPLVLYVEEVTRAGVVTVSALNGPLHSGQMYVPEFDEGTKLHVMEVALSESEVEVAPDNANPLPTKVFLQKKVCSITYTDLWNRMKKQASWDLQDVKDWVLRLFRRKCTRNHLIGVAKKWTKPGTKRTGEEFAYTEQGVLRQLRIGYQLQSKPTFADLVAISAILGGKYSISDEYDVYCGTIFYMNLHQLDYSKHPEVQFERHTDGETKIKITSFESGFTTMNFKKEHGLDDIGYADSAMAFSVKKAKHYFIPHNDISIDHSKGEGGEVREAKSDYYILEDCLKLTELNSMFISPRASLVDDSYLNNLTDVIASVTAFPTSPSPAKGDKVSLVCDLTETDAVSGATTTYAAGIYEYDGTNWVPSDIAINA